MVGKYYDVFFFHYKCKTEALLVLYLVAENEENAYNPMYVTL